MPPQDGPLPQEHSQTESFAEPSGGPSIETIESSTGMRYESTTVDGEQSVDAGESHKGLSAAREHLAAVVQELSLLQEKFDTVNEVNFQEEPEELEPDEMETDPAILAPVAPYEVQELRRRVMHLEVDRDEAATKAKRLEAEVNALHAHATRLEAELRRTSATLEHTKHQLRHRDIDLHQLRGGGPLPPAPAAPASPPAAAPLDADEEGTSGKDGLACPTLNEHAHLGATGVRKLDASAPKQQVVAALKSAQGMLVKEQQKHEKTQKRAQKDRERLEKVTAIAERQRDDLQALREHGQHVEQYTRECESRLKKLHSTTTLLNSTLNQSPPDHIQFSGFSSTPVGAGAGRGGPLSPGNSSMMSRNASAPTRLPTVGNSTR